MLAANADKLELVTLLLERGADVNAKTTVDLHHILSNEEPIPSTLSNFLTILSKPRNISYAL